MDTKKNVTELPMADREGKVLNCELTFNLGKSAQARLLTDFPQGISHEAMAIRLDAVDRQGRRLQARYQLDDLLEEAEDRQAQIEQWKQDFADAELVFKKKIEEINVKIGETRRGQADFEQGLRQRHADTGRREEWKAKGSEKSRLEAYARTLAGYRDEITKQEAERAQALDALQVNVRAAEKAIARIERKQKRLQAIVDAKE